MVSFFDLILILVLFAFGLFGFWFGLLHALGSLLGTVVGAVIASRYYTLWGDSNTTKVIAFIILYAVASRLTSFVFVAIEKFFKVAKFIPGVAIINRVAGAALGLAEGMIAAGVVLYFVQKFPLGSLAGLIASSPTAEFLIWVGGVVIPLFPEVLRQAQSVGNILP